MSGESNIERDRRKRSLIDTPQHPARADFFAAGMAELAERHALKPEDVGDFIKRRYPEEFRTRPGKLKPGSLTENGMVVAVDGLVHEMGPCFVPFDALSPARKAMMGQFGWHRETRAAYWPGIPNSNRDMCIVRLDK